MQVATEAKSGCAEKASPAIGFSEQRQFLQFLRCRLQAFFNLGVNNVGVAKLDRQVLVNVLLSIGGAFVRHLFPLILFQELA
jgi:hypothetical protein